MRLVAVALCTWLTLGCQKDDEHPPVAPCVGTSCAHPVGGGTQSGGEGGASSSPGAAGAAGATPLDGVVVRFENEDFKTVADYTDPVDVVFEGAAGKTLTETWDGMEAVDLSFAAPEGFVLLNPTPPGTDVLPTLLRLPANGPSPVELQLTRESVVDLILSVPSVPTMRAAGRAQVVLELLDTSSGKPLAGAQVSEPSAEVVLYSSGGSFTDAFTTTDESGLCILVNVTGSAWPGSLSSITVSGSALGSVPARGVADAVTYLTASITP